MRVPRTSATHARALGLLLAVLFAIGSASPTVHPARAATTFVVNLPADDADSNPGNGACDARPAPGSQCTLRAAIQQANATPGADTIAFAIPSTGVHTVRPTSPLPPIVDAVTIDGYTQVGASVNTRTDGTTAQLRIELDGSAMPVGIAAAGLRIRADNTVVRGLVINRFSSAGIAIEGSLGGNPIRGVRIAGNFIGTNAAGSAARANLHGVTVYASGTTVIGGTARADRNLISGNTYQGVWFNNTVAVGNAVQGNLIGTQRDGHANLRNGASGILLHDSAKITVGGDVRAAGNRIAHNGREGVRVDGGIRGGNPILRNSIFFNGLLGIDLGGDGPTPNDDRDADTGPNGLQNTPELTDATTTDGSSVVHGHLNSIPNATFLVQIFSRPGGDEGKHYRGQRRIATDAAGNVVFAIEAEVVIQLGHVVTATATNDATGDTSEFSATVTAVGGR